ncbi:hypothetical protein [Actinoplanes teichomyceticus]|uniref:Uncharacterized protein n=1 Tax=Actinoplanes teichomyceticus TaxID=1867 RepID=A0A561VGK5_ACTTI|nr:hypothetical protein [Actinoplanes teichomyceticus]TWG10739.1 hypothetical protein FHX34_107235 [Actinoplanes teichomyceticus]GIF12637.1 hypothetical protein Ate01nite_26690 [Actinoplanes teichomyceticus]
MSVAATLERFAATMPQAAARDEIGVARVRWLGTRGWVAYSPDRAQQQFRKANRIPPILALDLLDTLMYLPFGHEVAVQSMAVAAQRRLRRLPAGAVTWSSTTVTRRIAPPVTPLLAMVQATDWATGLRAASRFAMYCRRLMVIPELPADERAALAEASFYGIGVAVRRGESLTTVLEPEEFTEWQPTAAWWRFTEEVARGAGKES